jgi:hypothetical protein
VAPLAEALQVLPVEASRVVLALEWLNVVHLGGWLVEIAGKAVAAPGVRKEVGCGSVLPGGVVSPG